MGRLVRWISENKRWVFSGIGTTVFLVIIPSLLWWLFSAAPPSSLNQQRIEVNSGSTTAVRPQVSDAPLQQTISPPPGEPRKSDLNSAEASLVSPVSIEDVIGIGEDANLTELQKDAFRKRYAGKLVQWEGRIVGDISSLNDESTSPIVTLIVPPSVGERDSRLGKTTVSVLLKVSARDDLIRLHAGDTISFRGRLKFSGGKNPYVEEAELLAYHRATPNN